MVDTLPSDRDPVWVEARGGITRMSAWPYCVIDGEAFLAYVEQQLVPALAIVIADDPSSLVSLS